jgi:hypothetical protein
VKGRGPGTSGTRKEIHGNTENKQTPRDREGTRGKKKRKGKSEEEGETGASSSFDRKRCWSMQVWAF